MKRLLFVALTLLVVSHASAAEPTLASLVEIYENPTLGPSIKVDNLSIGVSNLTIELTSGSASPVMAGKEAIGIFFVGNGKYTYTTNDAMEAPVTLFQARKASKIKAEKIDKGVVLTDSFNKMFLRAGGIGLPPLPTVAGASLSTEFTAHRASFKRGRTMPATHLLVRQKMDKPTSPVAWIEFEGDEMSTYMLDTIETRTEGIFELVRIHEMGNPELRAALHPISISEQAVGRNRRDFVDPPYLLTHLGYTLLAEANETAKLDVTETITPRGSAQKSFRFSMHDRVWDSNNRPRNYHVNKVTDEKGQELHFHHDGGSLLVGLPQKQAPNTPFKLRFDISGDFLYHPNGDSFWQLGTEPWFPQPDLNGQYYTIHSTVKVRKPWIAFIPGNQIRREAEGDYNVIETKIEKPVQFAVAHAGKYAVSEEKYDDLTIRVASYAGTNDRAMKQLGNLAWKMIKFYEPWLGPFPFKEFNIIEINELGYGQAPPGTMFITKEAFNPTLGDDNQLFSRGINHRFAHEIAHQYWGHVVKMGSLEEQWVTEAFAEYSSSLVIKKLKGEGAYQSMVSTWRANARDAAKVAPIALANRIQNPNDWRQSFIDRTFLLYNKGAYVLAVLHKQLGDQKFHTFLRSLQGFFEWKYLTTQDMARLLQRIDEGKDYMPFFEQYYWGLEMPQVPKS